VDVNGLGKLKYVGGHLSIKNSPLSYLDSFEEIENQVDIQGLIG
jgi:hypothetical protein